MKSAIAVVVVAVSLSLTASALADPTPAIAVVAEGSRAPFAGVLLTESAVRRIESDCARDIAGERKSFELKLAAAEAERKRAVDAGSAWKRLTPLWTALGAVVSAAVAGAAAAASR